MLHSLIYNAFVYSGKPKNWNTFVIKRLKPKTNENNNNSTTHLFTPVIRSNYNPYRKNTMQTYKPLYMALSI